MCKLSQYSSQHVQKVNIECWVDLTQSCFLKGSLAPHELDGIWPAWLQMKCHHIVFIHSMVSNEWWLLFCMYILMKRDMSDKLFLLCQICGFICNYKSFNNPRSQRLKTILNIQTITNNVENISSDFLSLPCEGFICVDCLLFIEVLSSLQMQNYRKDLK